MRLTSAAFVPSNTVTELKGGGWHVTSVPTTLPGEDAPGPRPSRPLEVVPSTLTRLPRRLVDRTLLRWGVRPFLVLGDVVAATTALLVTGAADAGISAAFVALTVLLIGVGRLYRSRLSLSALDDMPSLVGRVLAAAGLVVSLQLLAGSTTDQVPLLYAAGATAVLVVLARALAYRVVRSYRARGWVAHPTLILGAGQVGGMLASTLLNHPFYGLKPVGFLDNDPLLDADERPVPLLGGHESLSKVILEFGVRDVMVAFGSMPESRMVDIIRTCDRLDVEIFFVPRLFELHHTSHDVDQVWGIPLLRLRRAAFRSQSWRLKRALDIVVAAVGLVLAAPLMAVLAAAVRLEGGSGILFRQERIGLDGRPFALLKFRSLRPSDDQESATRWSVAEDSRVGPVGRLLRRTSLDELPQLWNILRGDMTLVGPRPERPHFVDEFSRLFPRYPARHRAPAGLTGWAQVHGLRGDTSIEDRARFDNYYIENWSLWGDAKILLRTLSAVVRREGA